MPQQQINPAAVYFQSALVPRNYPELIDSIERYTTFLRAYTGHTATSKIDEETITTAFGLRKEHLPLLPSQRGLTIEPIGLIGINGEDIATRQRFTFGHELMELYFSYLVRLSPSPTIARYCDGRDKENLCERGSGMLLMPPAVIKPMVDAGGVSIAMASRLTYQFGSSLTAAFIAMISVADEPHAVVSWKLAWKESEKSFVRDELIPLFDDYEFRPPKKIRVQWSMISEATSRITIFREKSAEENSPVLLAHSSGTATTGADRLHTTAGVLTVSVEARPFQTATDSHVIALYSLPESVRAVTLEPLLLT
ncbi:MAG: hypothetical protein ABIR47_13860 [Candidatus Kapaibacterium sp.]